MAAAKAKGLSPDAIVREALDKFLAEAPAQPAMPRKSAYGLLAKYGPGPTEEEIDENRREMFRGFGEDLPCSRALPIRTRPYGICRLCARSPARKFRTCPIGLWPPLPFTCECPSSVGTAAYSPQTSRQYGDFRPSLRQYGYPQLPKPEPATGWTLAQSETLRFGIRNNHEEDSET